MGRCTLHVYAVQTNAEIPCECAVPFEVASALPGAEATTANTQANAAAVEGRKEVEGLVHYCSPTQRLCVARHTIDASSPRRLLRASQITKTESPASVMFQPRSPRLMREQGKLASSWMGSTGGTIGGAALESTASLTRVPDQHT